MPDEFLKWNETVAAKAAAIVSRSESAALDCVLSYSLTEVNGTKDLEIVVVGLWF